MLIVELQLSALIQTVHTVETMNFLKESVRAISNARL